MARTENTSLVYLSNRVPAAAVDVHAQTCTPNTYCESPQRCLEVLLGEAPQPAMPAECRSPRRPFHANQRVGDDSCGRRTESRLNYTLAQGSLRVVDRY